MPTTKDAVLKPVANWLSNCKSGEWKTISTQKHTEKSINTELK